jgi:hypothetical protein
MNYIEKKTVPTIDFSHLRYDTKKMIFTPDLIQTKAIFAPDLIQIYYLCQKIQRDV